MGRPKQESKSTRRAYDKATGSAASSQPFVVEMTASAEAVYKEMAKRAREAEQRKDASDPHYTAFRTLREAIHITIPNSPSDQRHALAGDLSNIYRIKQGKVSICWLTSSERRRIIILFISESSRKEGEVKDAYGFFASMVMSGRIDGVFEKLGIDIPPKRPVFSEKSRKQ